MPDIVQEVYEKQILPLSEKDRLKLAALIISDISDKNETNGEKKENGVREMFGAVGLGQPTGADNESIDADLAREYGSTHEDE
jgi:hypothetical protein